METKAMENATVARGSIIVDESRNARKSYLHIEELSESIKREGQQIPVVVRPLTAAEKAAHGTADYMLVDGYRRMRALGALKAASVRVQIDHVDSMKGDVLSMRLNMDRDQLSTYEIAIGATEMADRYGGLTGAEIGRELGKDGKTISNLMRIVRKVAPSILDAWKSGDKRCGMANLLKWAAEDPADQVADFDAQGEDGDGAEDGEGERVPGRAKAGEGKRGPSRKQLEALWGVLKGGEVDKHEAWIEGATAIVAFALGKTKTVAGVYDPKKKAEKPAKEAKAVKTSKPGKTGKAE